MVITTRVEAIDKDLALIFAEEFGPEARSAVLADTARQALADAQAQNASALGRVPPHRTFVDGAERSDVDRVRPDGVIIYEFALIADTLIWISDQLQKAAPVKTGRFQKSFAVFADGVEIDVGAVVPAAAEYVFVNFQPYARKIERGLSPQAPHGVFEAAATLAARRFGNTARVRFTYRTPVAGALAGGKAGDRSKDRTPAIVVTVR